jgi:hypothetical protein
VVVHWFSDGWECPRLKGENVAGESGVKVQMWKMFEVEVWECKREHGKRKILTRDLPQNLKPVSKNDLIFIDMHLNGAIAWGNSALDVILWGPGNPIRVHKSAFQFSLSTSALR